MGCINNPPGPISCLIGYQLVHKDGARNRGACSETFLVYFPTSNNLHLGDFPSQRLYLTVCEGPSTLQKVSKSNEKERDQPEFYVCPNLHLFFVYFSSGNNKVVGFDLNTPMQLRMGNIF